VIPRASVSVVRGPTEVQVMNLMDAVIDAVAQQVFGVQVTAAKACQAAGSRRRWYWQSTKRSANPALLPARGDTGLALSMTRWAIERQSGHIKLESELGYSSLFRIAMPK